MGILYIVPTPIGNLEDITLRALRILETVSLIAAEDTRTTKVLLNHYELTTPMTSYHEHNKLAKLDRIFFALKTGDVALVSDAGTPGISDPGYELIGMAIELGYNVVPLPGANAVTTALVGSGLPTDTFLYLGFLPKKEKARRQLLKSVRDERHTLIAYENPYRLTDTLKDIVDIFGKDRPVCVAREISKMFEEFYRDRASSVAARYEMQPAKGEVTLVIGGSIGEASVWDVEQVKDELEERLGNGEKLNKAAKEIAKVSGWNKRDIYTIGTHGI